jgi:hypothetical protein
MTEVLDPGHRYKLLIIDQERSRSFDHEEILTFVKREGDGYPGNTGHHAGTTLQSVLRACLNRVHYLQGQYPCWQNRLIIHLLRWSFWLLEHRAYHRHGNNWFIWRPKRIAEEARLCPTCGHTVCNHPERQPLFDRS